MRKRNPDLEAYRSWQSDRSDRVALDRYLHSFERYRETPGPEQILELEANIPPEDSLRPYYRKIIPNYGSPNFAFKQDRWNILVSKYAWSEMNPRAILLLIYLGIRSSIPLISIYEILHEQKIISSEIFNTSSQILNSDSQTRIHYNIKNAMEIIPQIPAFVYGIKNNIGFDSCFYAFEDLRGLSAIATEELLDFLNENIDSVIDRTHRSMDSFKITQIIRILGYISTESPRSAQRFLEMLKDERYEYFHEVLSSAIGDMGLIAECILPELMSLSDIEAFNHHNRSEIAGNCIFSAAKITRRYDVILPFLKYNISDKIKNEKIRTAAIEGLSVIYPFCPEVLPILIDYARLYNKSTADRSHQVCIDLLGRRLGFPTVESVEVVLEILSKSYSSNKKLNCAIALLNAENYESLVAPCVAKMILNDESYHVRSSCLSVLIEYGKDAVKAIMPALLVEEEKAQAIRRQISHEYHPIDSFLDAIDRAKDL